jgi:hypothetical protein
MTMVATVTWQGQERRVIRLALPTDEGFDPEAPPDSQVVIKMGDGSEIVVPITGDDTAPPEPEPTEPPTVVDAPYVSQSGQTLNCTMGNWNAMGTGTYAYQWQLDGVDVSGDGANYTVTPADVGKQALCVLTATNSIGSEESTSNEITIV